MNLQTKVKPAKLAGFFFNIIENSRNVVPIIFNERYEK